jgi:hypothetical protein
MAPFISQRGLFSIFPIRKSSFNNSKIAEVGNSSRSSLTVFLDHLFGFHLRPADHRWNHPRSDNQRRDHRSVNNKSSF